MVVEGATVFARLLDGRLTQFGSRQVGPGVAHTLPLLDADDAWIRLLLWSGDAETAVPVGNGELRLQPEEGDSGIVYRLIWRRLYRANGRVETWEGRVDARTGEVVGFRDVNDYSRVTGGIHPRSAFLREEVEAPLSFLSVSLAEGTAMTDGAGRFPYRGGRARASLAGPFVRTVCVGCTAPGKSRVETDIGAGLLDFGMGGLGPTGNGRSTPAARNAFFHINRARRIGLGWLPGSKWLRGHDLTAAVNEDDLACNAYYIDELQSLHFFRARDGCHNTGEVSDIIYHEWGHGLDHRTRLGDRATGEGTADVTAMHLTRGSEIGLGFRISGAPIRDLDADRTSLGLLTLHRVNRGDCRLPFGGDSVHCIGQLYGQAAWELSRALIDRHGNHTGWRVSERLFYTSLPDAGTYLPEGPLSLYAAYLMADDDDGNLANGTPHATEIHEAFARHGIAEEPLPSSPACEPPAQPTHWVETECDALRIHWTPVDGATRYEILRSELLEDTAYGSRARLAGSASEYLDTEIAPGVDYWYTVMAVDDVGCESSVESPVSGRLPGRALLNVAGVVVNDDTRGNRSGSPDPGEEIELTLRLENLGDIDARNVQARILGTTGGSTRNAQLSWPDVAVGQSLVGSEPLRLRIDPATRCGDTVRLELAFDDPSCEERPVSYVDVVVGTPQADGTFVCDATPACFSSPEFDGLASVSPGPSCGEISLDWPEVPSACPDSEVTFEVHRSREADFAPDDSTLIAGQLRETHWIDRLLEPGQLYFYAVRAVDRRSGADDNRVVARVRAATGPDDRPPVFAGIRSAATGAGCREVDLHWDPAAESCSLPVAYEIHRSTDPLFVPGDATLVGSTFDRSFTDVSAEAGAEYTYLVVARDTAGNASPAKTRRSVTSRTFDHAIVNETFESNDGNWRVVEPNDATTGNWEWGIPEETEIQPGQDATAIGARCWMTGLSRATADGNNNDVDFGTTTLLSARYQLEGAEALYLRYARWFTNDRGGNPGDPRDSLRLFGSDDDGASWVRLAEVGAGTPLAWETVEVPLDGRLGATDHVRFRFSVADPGRFILDASWVEAGIDDFQILERDRGCSVCEGAVAAVRTIRLARDGDDVWLDWTGTPMSPGGFAVYRLEGPRRERAVRIGTTHTTSFRHLSAITYPGDLAYRVSALDECGRESLLVPESPR